MTKKAVAIPEPVIQPLAEVLARDPEGVGPEVEHPEIDRLRRELAEKQKELQATREQLAAAMAPLESLPNSGPGKYEVILRHSPSRLKSAVIEADSETDAWNKFVQEAMAKNNNPKDPERRDLRAFEAYLRQGRISGYSRSIKKVG